MGLDSLTSRGIWPPNEHSFYKHFNPEKRRNASNFLQGKLESNRINNFVVLFFVFQNAYSLKSETNVDMGIEKRGYRYTMLIDGA